MDCLLCIYLHGFNGGDDSFVSFPQRISSILSASHSADLEVIDIIYPAYATRGTLENAVENFVGWLVDVVAKHEEQKREEEKGGEVKVVLLGHSMGGIVILDALRALENQAWPKVLGVIAYDTPFWGLNPAVFKTQFERVLEKGKVTATTLGLGWAALSAFSASNKTPPSPTTRDPTSPTPAPSEGTKYPPPTTEKKSSFSPWLYAGAAAATALAVGGGVAYAHRETIAGGLDWVTSHLLFVGELFRPEKLEERMAWLAGIVDQDKAVKGRRFHCFYTSLRPSSSPASPPRLFINLPSPLPIPLSSSFAPNVNSRSADEIRAHVDMFEEMNDGMYVLGQETCEVVWRWWEEEGRRANSLRQKESGGGGGSGVEWDSLMD